MRQLPPFLRACDNRKYIAFEIHKLEKSGPGLALVGAALNEMA
jgi:hypothetical protein